MFQLIILFFSVNQKFYLMLFIQRNGNATIYIETSTQRGYERERKSKRRERKETGKKEKVRERFFSQRQKEIIQSEKANTENDFQEVVLQADRYWNPGNEILRNNKTLEQISKLCQQQACEHIFVRCKSWVLQVRGKQGTTLSRVMPSKNDKILVTKGPNNKKKRINWNPRLPQRQHPNSHLQRSPCQNNWKEIVNSLLPRVIIDAFFPIWRSPCSLTKHIISLLK